jgi:hypothetical protein
MKILFTKSTLPLSVAIRSVSGEPVSHVALEFPELGIVVQSNLLGIGLEWSSYFREKCTVVYELDDGKSDLATDKAKLTATLDAHENDFYDFTGLIYLGMRTVLNKYLKIPMPKTDVLRISNTYLCTEWVTEYIDGTPETTITPYGLYEQLKATGKWTEIDN